MTSNASYDGQTGAFEVAKAYGHQVAGKTVLVTGVSVGGIGEAITAAFAAAGASTIIITGRNDQRLAEVNKKLSSEYPSTKFKTSKFDMFSLKSVDQAAKAILNDTSIPKIDVFVGNAVTSIEGPRVLTEDGLEQHFAGFVGHRLLLTVLLPKIQLAAKDNAPGSTRVVLLSSSAQSGSAIRFSDYNFDLDKPLPDSEKPDFTLFKLLGVEETDGFSHHIAYGQAKTAMTLLAVQINKLFSSDPNSIFSFALHPGIVRSTGAIPLWEGLSDEQKNLVNTLGGGFRTIDQGAATVLIAALDPGLKPEAGVFLTDSQIAEAPAHATDPEQAEKLWSLTDSILRSKGFL